MSVIRLDVLPVLIQLIGRLLKWGRGFGTVRNVNKGVRRRRGIVCVCGGIGRIVIVNFRIAILIKMGIVWNARQNVNAISRVV